MLKFLVQEYSTRLWYDCSDAGFARLNTNHRLTFCGLLSAVFNADSEWINVFKEKCEINHLQDLNTMPTVTVMAKWFLVNKLARVTASNLVQIHYL